MEKIKKRLLFVGLLCLCMVASTVKSSENSLTHEVSEAEKIRIINALAVAQEKLAFSKSQIRDLKQLLSDLNKEDQKENLWQQFLDINRDLDYLRQNRARLRAVIELLRARLEAVRQALEVQLFEM